MKKRSRFFCENCGAEVAMDSRRCPRCGRSFVSVRCQACGFTGEEASFDQGCPVCGYAAPAPFNREEKQKAAIGSLPSWVYVLTALVFGIVGFLVFFTLR
ncbi:MAG: zinc-ribbon domain-containing protein [Treponema sp.]|jgi:rubrerythrin|nr:zinc-ribbon domain-containing protein [Treponema sp.]